MRSVAFILTCLTCVGHGRRVQTEIDNSQHASDTAPASRVPSDVNQQHPQSLAELTHSQTWNPAAAWRAPARLTAGTRQSSQPGLQTRNIATEKAGIHEASPLGTHFRSGKHAQMRTVQNHAALHPEFFPGAQAAREKVSDSAPPRLFDSAHPGRLAALLLFLAFSGSVPALALARQQRANGKRASAPVMTAAAATAGAATAEASSDSGTATMSSSIINLAKNIVGSGVLSLSAGIATFSAAPAAVLPAMAVLLSLGGASGYSFALIARAGKELGASSYSDTWAKAFGKSTSIIPALTIAFMTIAAGLAYSIILGDSFASIASLAGLPAILCASNTWIIGLSVFLLLPLSLLRDLSSLAIGSVIGTAGTLYTALFMTLRWIEGSYAAGGKFHAAIAESAQPVFAAASSTRPLMNPAVFVLISMLSSAFLAHYNAPKYFKELAPPKDGGSKDKSFNIVVGGAFGLAALLCASIMLAGYLTFGGASNGFILNNYATSDPLAFLARLGISASIIFSYPLNFVGLREGILNIFKLDGSKSSIHIIVTLILLCGMNGMSLVLKDLGLVCAVGGALLGSALVYIFPALMFIQATRLKKKALEAEGGQLPARRLKEMYANYGLAGLGVVLAVIGVIMSLKSV